MIYLSLYVTIIYQMNTKLYWRRLETSDWPIKLIRKMFSEAENRVKTQWFPHWLLCGARNERSRPLLAITKNAGSKDLYFRSIYTVYAYIMLLLLCFCLASAINMHFSKYKNWSSLSLKTVLKKAKSCDFLMIQTPTFWFLIGCLICKD